MPARTKTHSSLAIAIALVGLTMSSAEATLITLGSAQVVAAPGPATTESSKYLLVGTGLGTFGTTVSVNSGFELGAHLPLDGSVPTNGGGQGPDVGGVTIPTGAAVVGIGIGGNGDTALTTTTGTFNFQTIDGEGLLAGVTGRSGIYGDTGVQCSQSAFGCTAGNSNTYFSSAGTFPMPITSLLSTTNGIVAGDANTLDTLESELASAPGTINFLASSFSIAAGTFTSDLIIELDNPGLYVIDVTNTGQDWDLGNYDILIDGVAGSSVIFRIAGGVNMKTSNSFIGIGDDGIGLNNVLFYTQQANDNGHFNFNNVVLNGVAFWDLSNPLDEKAPDLAVSNGQGCAQFIGEQIVMNNVRFNNCAFNPQSLTLPPGEVPEPGALALLGLGLAALAATRRRKQ